MARLRSCAAPAADVVEPVAAALRRKYPQYETVPLFSGEPTLIRIEAAPPRGWCASPEALA